MEGVKTLPSGKLGPSITSGFPTIRPESLVSLATPALVDAHVVERYVGNTDLPGHHEPFRKARTPDQMRRSRVPEVIAEPEADYCAKPTRRDKSWKRGSLRSG